MELRDSVAWEDDNSVQAIRRNGGEQGEGDLNVKEVEERASEQGDEGPGEC